MNIKDLKLRDLKKLAKKLGWKHKPLSDQSNSLSTYREALDGSLPITTILVSESLQNALDVGSQTITFEWVTFPVEVLELIGWSELMKRGAKLAAIEALRSKKTVSCLLIVDEGPGLGGDYINPPGANDTPGNFAALVRSYGNSSKGAGNSGSKGIGSTFALIISEIQAVVYITRRAEDGKLLMTGKNDMSIHEYEGASYQYDGMLIDTDKDGALPAEGELAETIANALGMGFGKEETGLCTFIPAVSDEVTPTELIKTILNDHFVPVILRRLKIFVKSPDFDTIEISDDTIAKLAADPKFGLNKDHFSTLQCVHDAFEALEGDDIIEINLGTERLTADALDEDDINNLAASLNDGVGAIGISASFDAIRKGGVYEDRGRIEYGIMYSPDLSTGMEIHLRDGISVIRKKVGSPYILVTVAGFGDSVAAMLRDGENASHNLWAVQRMLGKGWETKSANAVCHSFSKGAKNLLQSITQNDIQIDNSTFADVFFMPEGDRPVGSDKKAEDANDANGTEKSGKETVEPTPLVQEAIEMDKNGLWGFKVRLNEDGLQRLKSEKKLNITVSATYASSEIPTNHRRHSSSDFDLGDFQVSAQGCKDHDVKHRSVDVFGIGSDFELTVIGAFDENRALDVAFESMPKNAKTKTAR